MRAESRGATPKARPGGACRAMYGGRTFPAPSRYRLQSVAKSSDGRFDGTEGMTATGYLVGRCERRVWGLDPAERWRRWLARAGVGALRREGEPLPAAGAVVLVRADHVAEESLAGDLLASPDTVLVADGPAGRRPVAAHVRAERAAEAADGLRRGDAAAAEALAASFAVKTPAELSRGYDKALRKRGVPYVLSLTELPPDLIERRTFGGAYKGVTDFVTKWLWPVPARWATRWAAERGISANAVTAASLVLVLLALVLFAEGRYALGLLAAWLMTFLDTVDGKLARVTLTATRRGEAFDHGIDLLHPPFWYAAWWLGLGAAGAAGGEPASAALLEPALWIVVGGYVAGRLMEGLFLAAFRFEIHAWRPIDSRFRLVTARRNPNLVLLTAGTLAGRPDLGFLAVAAWTLLSLLFHGLRLGQAFLARAAGRPVRSWLAEPAAAPAA